MSDITRQKFFEDLPKTQEKVWEEQNNATESNFDYIYESGVESWKWEHQDDDPEPAFPEDPYSDPAFMRGYEEAERETMEYGGVGEAALFINEFMEHVKKGGAKQSAYQKHAIWSDIVEKATRYLNEGRVQMQNNMPDHSIATVTGDTGVYTTEIWRQDPSRPNTLSGWSCTCPWGEHSWGRTRIWKKYEGRPCAHTVVLSWESQKQP